MQATAITVRKPRHFQASQEERNRQRHKSENCSGKHSFSLDKAVTKNEMSSFHQTKTETGLHVTIDGALAMPKVNVQGVFLPLETTSVV